MSVSPWEAPPSPETEPHRRWTSSAKWLLTAAVGIIVGGLAAFVVAPRAYEDAESPVASTPPTEVVTSPPSTSTPGANVDQRYPVAPALDADALARVGDLWRLESASTFRDDAAPGPTAVYLVSPSGDRYLAGIVATQGLTVLAWDAEGDVALVGGPDFMGGDAYFRLDLATGVARPDDPPASHDAWSVSRFGVGSDGRTYFSLGGGTGDFGAWAWSAAGWEEFALSAASYPNSAYVRTDAIVTGSEWLLWAESTSSGPRSNHLLNLSTGIDSPLPSLGDDCSTDGWHDATHLDVYCWNDTGGAGRHRLFDVSTGESSDGPEWSYLEDGYVYSSVQLPGTPLVFRYDNAPGFVSSISVLTKDGLKTLTTVAPEDQFQIGDVIEVRPGTYVIRDGARLAPGDEVVRAVIDAAAGFAAFGTSSDPMSPEPHHELRTTILVNYEGE
jgi:hypothetical protein